MTTDSSTPAEQTQEASAATEGLPSSDATVQQLLSWVGEHGYSGLTDAQIQLVVEYRAEVLAQGEALRQQAEQMRQQHEELLSQARQAASEAQGALARALSSAPTFEEVSS